jgi:tubulin gamma
MKEIITFQIGKCGINLGHEFWKQILFEYDLDPCGKIFFDKKNLKQRKDIFFEECPGSNFKPRTILFDLEPRIVSVIQKGTYKNLYMNKNIFIGKKNIGNNWVAGYNHASEDREEIAEIIRKNAERCNNLGGFNFFHSIGGGTGAGSSSFVLELINEEYPKKFNNFYSLIPDQDQTSDIVVEPYNSVLALRWLILYSDCVTFFENSSLEKIITRNYLDEKIYIKHINLLISKIISNSISSITHGYSPDFQIENFIASSVPLPNLHFLFAGISDCKFPGRRQKENLTKLNEMDRLLQNLSINTDIDKGKFLSISHFIGEKIPKNNIYLKIDKLYKKKNLKFRDWAPFSIQTYNCNRYKNKKIRIENFCFFNNTSIRYFFGNTLKKYEILKKRNAFLNNFLIEFDSKDGLELFEDAKENLENLILDYDSIENNS